MVFKCIRYNILLLCLFFGMLCDTYVAKAGETIVIITYPEIETQTLSKNTLRSVFSMRLKTWPDKMPIKVFVLPDDHPIHGEFTKGKLNVFSYQLRSTWDRLVFSGTGQAPIKVNTYEEMLDGVAKTPGAIGYLKKSQINNSVRVLDVE